MHSVDSDGINTVQVIEEVFEHVSDKTKKFGFMPREDSQQSEQRPGPIRVLAGLMVKLHIETTVNTLIRLKACPGWSDPLLGV